MCRVFLDTSILKHAIFEERVFAQEIESVNWGGDEFVLKVSKPFSRIPFLKIGDNKFRKEVQLLQEVALLTRDGHLKLYQHSEVIFEQMTVQRSTARRSWFEGIQIELVQNPFPYSRVIGGGGRNDYAVSFLAGITDQRYLQLKALCGANPDSPKYLNNLYDAFHLLCAERAGLEYFLTLDIKLVNKVKGARSHRTPLRVVKPSELLFDLRPKT